MITVSGSSSDILSLTWGCAAGVRYFGSILKGGGRLCDMPSLDARSGEIARRFTQTCAVAFDTCVGSASIGCAIFPPQIAQLHNARTCSQVRE